MTKPHRLLAVTAIVLVGSCGWLCAQENRSVPVTITGCVASPSSDTQPLLRTYTTPSHKGKPDYIRWSSTDHEYKIQPVPGQPWPFAKTSYDVRTGHPVKGEISSATQNTCSKTTACDFVYQITGCTDSGSQGPTATTVSPTAVHSQMHVKG